MVEFLKGWGSLIIATVALIQPWVVGIWRKLFRGGKIEIHETGTIEVGFSGFGPTIGCHGTLRGLHRDQFIRSIDLALVRLRDGSRHSFDWGIFRTQKLNIGGQEEGSLELPYGFMLLTTQPHRYNIQFFDVPLQKEMRFHIEAVQRAWTNVLVMQRPLTACAGPNRPPVPDQAGHPFRSMPAAHSGRSRPPVDRGRAGSQPPRSD